MSFLTVDKVSKQYGVVKALIDVSLEVGAGRRAAIVGPSGSGKSTLLRLIAGFDVPDTGRIVLAGTVVADGAMSIPAYRRDIGVVMQDGALFPHLTIAENIGFGLDHSTPARATTIGGLVDMVGLDRSMLSRMPDALSGGQQQRVALARALARRPKLMLLDEPFSALDTGLRASTRQSVAQLLDDAGVASLLVTHDQAEALSFADHVAVMDGGKLLQAGPPRELYFAPHTPMVARFLGEAVILPAIVSNGWAQCALGRLPIGDRHRSGNAEIMLRPEQISLVTDGRGVPATVVEIDFAGVSSVVSLQLAGSIGGLIALRHPILRTVTAGTEVGILVAGDAYVFPGQVGGDGHPRTGKAADVVPFHRVSPVNASLPRNA